MVWGLRGWGSCWKEEDSFVGGIGTKGMRTQGNCWLNVVEHDTATSEHSLEVLLR